MWFFQPSVTVLSQESAEGDSLRFGSIEHPEGGFRFGDISSESSGQSESGGSTAEIEVSAQGAGDKVGTGGSTPVISVAAQSGGNAIRQGGSTPVISVSVQGSGIAVFQGGSTPVISVASQGAGNAVREGGSTPVIEAAAEGAGQVVQSESGGSTAVIEVAGQGSGESLRDGGSTPGIAVSAQSGGSAIREGGSTPVVLVDAQGAGQVVQSGSGGSTTTIIVTAQGAGSVIREGGSTSIIEVSAQGAGQVVESGEGGSTVPISVAAQGAGERLSEGGSTAVVGVSAQGAGEVVGSGQASHRYLAGGNTGAGSNTHNIALSPTAVAGRSLILVTWSVPGNDPTNVTDNGGGSPTYVLDRQDPSAGYISRIWRLQSIIGAPTQITVTTEGTNGIGYAVVEVDGLASSPLDASGAIDGTFTASPSVTVSVDSANQFGFGFLQTAVNRVPTLASGFDAMYVPITDKASVHVKDNLGAAGSKTLNPTIDSGTNCYLQFVTYRTAGGTVSGGSTVTIAVGTQGAGNVVGDPSDSLRFGDIAHPEGGFRFGDVEHQSLTQTAEGGSTAGITVAVEGGGEVAEDISGTFRFGDIAHPAGGFRFGLIENQALSQPGQGGSTAVISVSAQAGGEVSTPVGHRFWNVEIEQSGEGYFLQIDDSPIPVGALIEIYDFATDPSSEFDIYDLDLLPTAAVGTNVELQAWLEADSSRTFTLTARFNDGSGWSDAAEQTFSFDDVVQGGSTAEIEVGTEGSGEDSTPVGTRYWNTAVEGSGEGYFLQVGDDPIPVGSLIEISAFQTYPSSEFDIYDLDLLESASVGTNVALQAWLEADATRYFTLLARFDDGSGWSDSALQTFSFDAEQQEEGGSTSLISVEAAGQGQKQSSQGSTSVIEVGTSGQGSTIRSGGSTSGIRIFLEGDGLPADQTGGGSTTIIRVGTDGDGTKQGQNGSSAVILSFPLGGGSKSVSGGSQSDIEIETFGGGTIAQQAEGGSLSEIAMLVLGGGHVRGQDNPYWGRPSERGVNRGISRIPGQRTSRQARGARRVTPLWRKR